MLRYLDSDQTPALQAQRSQHPTQNSLQPACSRPIRNEVGPRITRMRRIAHQSPSMRIASPLQLKGEQQVRQLRLLIIWRCQESYPGATDRSSPECISVTFPQLRTVFAAECAR